MTTVEKRVLIVLTAALILGTGLSTIKRAHLRRAAAARPVFVAGEVDSVVLRPGLLVNVNTAGRYELEALPGIGPVMASRVIAWRDRHGPFSSIEGLRQVPGIGPKRLEAIREFVVVGPDGDSW
jgi:competence ComEA-like helix-hairpin-helix protein